VKFSQLLNTKEGVPSIEITQINFDEITSFQPLEAEEIN
jgi:hypothetical protein